MSDSICKFMPAKGYSSDIRTVHFVYETEFKRLQQPFFSPTYRIVLVTKGTAVLKTHSGTFDLKPGSIFFTLPVDLHEIDAGDDFEYYYISFVGSGVAALLEELGITPSSPVYFDEYGLTDFWKASIQRINDKNINVLTESVLLYTLSFINNASDKDRKSTEKQFDFIIDYINNHYRERDLSLKKLAEIFSYTEKYLSYLFTKNMSISFKKYLNILRIQYAYKLLESNKIPVSEIAEMCGFSDSLYFSKVFKKIRGVSPSEYRKKLNN